MTKMIACGTCGSEFECMEGLERTEQAYRCAATVTDEDLIYGHYGSTVIDMECYRFSGKRPERVSRGHICDDCIMTLVDAGTIEIHSSGHW